MTYAVKEIFYTLQGEGANSGRAAVFCRFSGCNLWSGLEKDRATAVCKFCDTEFVGTDGFNGGKYTAEMIAKLVNMAWLGKGKPFVVCTGGEPLLQLDALLINAFHHYGFEVAIETNGTIEPPNGVDWICVSPKAGTTLVALQGDELKLIYPQDGADPELFEELPFTHFFLQPMDGLRLKQNTVSAVEYCKARPKWRLSIQMHKQVGIP